MTAPPVMKTPPMNRLAWGRRNFLRHTGAWSVTLGAQHGIAQPAWPTQPIRLLVVYAAGGLSDETARFIASKLASRLGVPVRVENRPGGGGSVGMELLAKSRPDGHTLAFSATSPLSLRPHLAKVNYEPLRDVVPIAAVMHSPVLVVGTPAFKGKTFQDVLDLSRVGSVGVRWATSGHGTTGHMVLEQVRLSSQIAITHIPYKGGGQPIAEALGGHFDVLSTQISLAVLQSIRSRELKPLAVGSPQRLTVLPDVPTLKELGFPEANLTSLFGIFAPVNTPISIVDTLNLQINAITKQSDFQERLSAANHFRVGGTAADFSRQISTESRLNAAAIVAANIKPE
jgi:tripartite-type tricarboxylate transporter receptor subunit TctC